MQQERDRLSLRLSVHGVWSCQASKCRADEVWTRMSRRGVRRAIRRAGEVVDMPLRVLSCPHLLGCPSPPRSSCLASGPERARASPVSSSGP